MPKFITLPQQGGDQRQVAEVVRGIMDGRTNNTGDFTLATGGATSTTIYDERIGYDSVILFEPTSAAAANNAFPYGAFQDTTDQAVTVVTDAYAVKFNTTDFSNGVTLSNNSRLNVSYAGLYNVQFSLQLSNMNNATEDVSVWFRKNGTDIAGSNSVFGLAPRKNATDPYHVIAALNFFVELQQNDYIEIMWSATNTLVTIDAKPTQTAPTRPSTPSVIATMQYVSSNGLTSNIFTDIYVSSQTRGSAVISHPANSVAGRTFKYIVVG